MRACFFARLQDPALLDIVDFYRNDITALRELGFDVVTATRFAEIPWNVDLYYTWWWGSGALTLIKSLPQGRPNIFTGTLQLTPEIRWWRELGPMKRSVVRACTWLASANVAIARIELDQLQRLRARNRHLVYQGLDTSLYTPPPADAPRGRTIVTVSHLTKGNVERKRLSTIVRAAPQVLRVYPDARFVMVGAHEDGYPELAALVRGLGVEDAFEFPGRVNTAEKVRAYQRARLLAQPTIYEGFGVAIAEAMACGLPVVTSRRGSVPEVVGDCGRYVEPDDAVAMAHEICDLLAHPAAAAELGARGRRRVEMLFSLDHHRVALARVIESVLPGWRPPVDTLHLSV